MIIEMQSKPPRQGLAGWVTRWLVNALGLILVSRVVKGIRFEGQDAALLWNVLAASAILGLVNAGIKPLLLLLTLPINLLSLGLFTLVINGGMLWLASLAVSGFKVDGFWPAVWGALLLSLISMLISALLFAGGLALRVRRGGGRL
jgi:putative membrane protein